MKAHYWIYGGLVILAGIIGYYSYRTYQNNTIKNRAIQQSFAMLNTKEMQLEENALRQISLEGNPFKDLLFENERGQKVKLDSLVNTIKLCMYVGPEYCSKCVAQHIETIKQHTENIGPENIVFLFQNMRPRDLKHFRLSNGFESPAISVLEMQTFSIDEPFPLFFTLDKSMKMNDVFVPLGNSPEFNEKYFTVIKKKYFE